MKIVILAAGRGSRMGSLTELKPKCLTVVGDKTLLERTLGFAFELVGRDNVIIVGGYRIDALAGLHTNIMANEQWQSTNIMGSLLVAEESLLLEDCIVIYSDIFFELEDLRRVERAPAPCLLSVSSWHQVWEKRFHDPLTDLESFTRTGQGYLKEIGLPVDSMNDVDGQFGGIYKLNPAAFRAILENVPDLEQKDTTSCLNVLPRLGFSVSIIDSIGLWAEFDSIDDLSRQKTGMAP